MLLRKMEMGCRFSLALVILNHHPWTYTTLTLKNVANYLSLTN